MDLRKVFDQTVRDLKREVNKKVLKVPEIEQKVLDATSNEAWGPHGTTMSEIAQATRNYNDFQLIMGILWKRLADTGRNWRHVYKSLTILDYLVAHGADRVMEELRENVYQIQGLIDFQYLEPNGKDQGINVRKKAQSLVSLLNDKEKIREVRQKAAANRDKYQGYSSTGGIFKPSSYSSTGGRGFNDWDDDRNGYKEPKDERFRSAFSDDERDEKKENDVEKTYSNPASQKKTEKKESSPTAKSLKSATTAQSLDDDDFDPRGSVPALRAAEVDLISQLDFFSGPSSVDPFSSETKPVPVSSATNLFASSDPFASADDFGAFTSASSAPAAAISSISSAAVDPFGELSGLQFESSAAQKPLEFDAFPPPQLGETNKPSQAPPVSSSFDAFGDFQASQSSSTFEAFTGTEVKAAAASQTSINTFMEMKTTSLPSSSSFDAFGDFKSAPASDASFSAFTDVKSIQATAAAPAPAPALKPSSLWADSLTSGLIDLNITAPKSADNGLQSHGSNLGSDWFMDDKAQAASWSSGGLGSDWFLNDKQRGAAGVSSANSNLGSDWFMDSKAAQSRSMGSAESSSGFGF